MFLQRNVAGQTFTIPGKLILKADGAAVTTSASIYVNGTGTSAGTLTHWRSGSWRYTPTQAETDFPFFEYSLEATDALGLGGTVRTTGADPNDSVALGLSALTTDPWSISGILLGTPGVSSLSVRLSLVNKVLPPVSDVRPMIAIVNTDGLSGYPCRVSSITLTGTTSSRNEYTVTLSDSLAEAPTAGDTVLFVGSSTKDPVMVAPSGLDAITIPTLSGVATTFPGKVEQLWRRFFKRVVKTTTQLTTYADDNVTVITTQPITDDGAGNQSQSTAT